MQVFQITHVIENFVINTDRLTFFVINVYYNREMNGVLFVFNCIEICLKLPLNAAFYIVF